MRSISEVLWDEWLAAPFSSPGEADLEAAALLLAMKERAMENLSSLRSKRFFVFRRLHKLWDAGAWKSMGDLGSLLRMPPDLKGHPSLSVTVSLMEKALELSDGVSGRNAGERWAWLRGVWGGAGSLYLPQTGYYLVIRIDSGKTVLRENIGTLLRKAKIRFTERSRISHLDILIRDQGRSSIS